MFVYTLTSLTGRKRNAGRTVLIQGFEFGRRALIVTAVSLGVSVVPAIMLAAIFGPMAFIIVCAASVLAAFVFYEQRSRKGMNVRMYEALRDKRQSDPKQFLICFTPVSVDNGWGKVTRSSAPVQPERTAPETIWTAPAAKRRISKGRPQPRRAMESE